MPVGRTRRAVYTAHRTVERIGNGSVARDANLSAAIFIPTMRNWIYMTLTEGAPGAGLWLSRDNGQTWHPFNELPFSNIQRVEFDRGDASRIFVTTFGGSVWRGPAG